MGTAVYEIHYRHAADGKEWRHEFNRPERVQLYVIDDSHVLIVGEGMPILETCVVPDD